MGSPLRLRLLVIDDLHLVAKCVESRIRLAAAESGFAHRRPEFIDWMSITSLERDRTVEDIGDRILRDRINFLIVDRGILERVDEVVGKSATEHLYLRTANPEYTDIIDILEQLDQGVKCRIRGVIIYTLDHPDRLNPWYVDELKISHRLQTVFGREICVRVMKTYTQVYQAAGLSLFYPSKSHPGREEARSADLQIYAAVVGEMVWRCIGALLFQRDVASRLDVARWFRRNYLIFLGATCGLGIGVSAAYDLLSQTFSTPWAMLVIGIALGVIGPLGLLSREPRLLMPPASEDES
jgi:hypothetical protein